MQRHLGDPIPIQTKEDLPLNYHHYLTQFPLIDNVDKAEAKASLKLGSHGWISVPILKFFWTGVFNVWVLHQQRTRLKIKLRDFFEQLSNLVLQFDRLLS